MKKTITISFVFVLVLVLCVPAFATEADSGNTDGVSGDSQTVVVPDVNVYNEVVVEDAGEELGEYVGTSVYALSPVTSSDVTGLKAVLLEFLGSYDAIVVEHAYENTNGYTSYVREIQYDWPWLASAALLLVLMFCFIRGGFSVLCRSR